VTANHGEKFGHSMNDVQMMAVHASYNKIDKSVRNDLAVLKVRRPFRYGDKANVTQMVWENSPDVAVGSVKTALSWAGDSQNQVSSFSNIGIETNAQSGVTDNCIFRGPNKRNEAQSFGFNSVAVGGLPF